MKAAAAPRPPLLSLDEVVVRIVGEVRAAGRLAAESVSTFDALGRVLARDVVSEVDVPPADNTSMDGYAVRCGDVAQAGAVLPVAQRLPAGVVGSPLQPGTAARIFTGAQVPPGADAIVMQEDTEPVEGGAVRVRVVPAPGQWIRRRGEDVAAGATVLASGRRLDPQALGLAASVGHARLEVVRRPRVALFSTGDELVMPGEVPPSQLPPGAIYNSNRFTLRALLQALGCECTDLGIIPDRLDATREALRRAADGHDLILTSGGVSVGEKDHLRPAVEAEGRVDFLQMAIKPGKPLAFGQVRGGAGATWLIGMPGNPVSSFVTFLLVARPALLAMQGADPSLPAALDLRADFDWPRPDRRREFLRARRNADGGLDLFPNQSSGVLTSAVWGDGLVDNPPQQAIRHGDRVRFLPFSALLG
jgi:molybdopterin molybdotransferase